MQSNFKLLPTAGFHNLLLEITRIGTCQSKPKLCCPVQFLFPPTHELISAFQRLCNGFDSLAQVTQRMVTSQAVFQRDVQKGQRSQLMTWESDHCPLTMIPSKQSWPFSWQKNSSRVSGISRNLLATKIFVKEDWPLSLCTNTFVRGHLVELLCFFFHYFCWASSVTSCSEHVTLTHVISESLQESCYQTPAPNMLYPTTEFNEIYWNAIVLRPAFQGVDTAFKTIKEITYILGFLFSFEK